MRHYLCSPDDTPSLRLYDYMMIHMLTPVPTYLQALSYVWSSTARPRTLSCEDVNIGLTESLFQALLRIRLPNADRRIWADQICIDQDDLEDRSHQVQFMNAIYKKAKCILVWLGSDEKNEASAAFDLVHGLANDIYDLDQDLEDYEERMVDWAPLQSLSRLRWVRCLIIHVSKLK